MSNLTKIAILLSFLNVWTAVGAAEPASNVECEEALYSNDFRSSDPYKILGIPRSAAESEIKAAFRAAVKKTHPDKPGGNASLFNSVTSAYETLMNLSNAEEGSASQGEALFSSDDFVDSVFKHRRTVWVRRPVIRMFGRSAEFGFVIGSKRYEPMKSDYSDFADMFEEAVMRPADYLSKNYSALLKIMNRNGAPPPSSHSRILASTDAELVQAFESELRRRLGWMFRTLGPVPFSQMAYGLANDKFQLQRYKEGDLSIGLSAAAIILQMWSYAEERLQNTDAPAVQDVARRLKELGFRSRAPKKSSTSFVEILERELHPVTFAMQVNRALLNIRTDSQRRRFMVASADLFGQRFGGRREHFLAFLLVYGTDNEDPVISQSDPIAKGVIKTILQTLQEELGIDAILKGKVAASFDHVDGLDFYLQVLSFADGGRLPYVTKVDNSVWWVLKDREFFERSIIRQHYALVEKRLKSTPLEAWLQAIQKSRRGNRSIEDDSLGLAQWFSYVAPPARLGSSDDRQ